MHKSLRKKYHGEKMNYPWDNPHDVGDSWGCVGRSGIGEYVRDNYSLFSMALVRRVAVMGQRKTAPPGTCRHSVRGGFPFAL